MSKVILYRCELCGKRTPAQKLTWALVDDICRTCFQPWKRGHNSAIQSFNHRLRILRIPDRKSRDNRDSKTRFNSDIALKNTSKSDISTAK